MRRGVLYHLYVSSAPRPSIVSWKSAPLYLVLMSKKLGGDYTTSQALQHQNRSFLVSGEVSLEYSNSYIIRIYDVLNQLGLAL